VLFREDGTATMEESFMKIRGVPYLKTHSITNIAWDENTQKFYEDNYDSERCLAAGANAYLSKPIRLKHLETTIRTLLLEHPHC